MIEAPYPALLFTWRDVADRLAARAKPTSAPHYEVDVFGLRVYGADRSASRNWVEEALGAAFDPANHSVRLEAPSQGARALPVELLCQEDAPEALPPVARPLWASTAPLPLAGDHLRSSRPIAAFFSFKGGVGRTTCCFATTLALLQRERPARVLYVDADVQAPGLTWMVDRPEERLSWVDALALVHESEDWRADVLPLIGERVALSSVKLELAVGRREFFFLPAVRHLDQIERLPATPEQLVRRVGRAWVVGDFLAALADALELDAILVDLRAGLTEFSSPLMLDPRVHNVLVTSCAEQSVQGTARALARVQARTQWTAETDIVVTFVPRDGDEAFAATNRAVVDTWVKLAPNATDAEEADAALPSVHRVDFTETLLVFDEMQPMADAIASTSLARVARELAETVAPTSRTAVTRRPPEGLGTREIAALARRLEYAEHNDQLGLLPTPSLRNLLEHPPSQLPVTVVLGSKGAGKTFTWGQLVAAGQWARFARALDDSPGAQAAYSAGDAHIFPLLQPAHLGESLRDRARELEGASDAGRNLRMSESELRGELSAGRATPTDPIEFWSDVIARRLGLPDEAGRSPRAIEQALAASNRRVVLVVDGLEDALQTGPTQPMSEGQRVRLRGLLSDLVTQLRDLGARHLGLIVFVRRDIAHAAFPQNFGQFEARHSGVALSWSHADALRLVHWLLSRAGWTLMDQADVAQAPYDRLAKELHPFWNEKMGGAKEAFTDRWVIAALSDLNGRFQARDLVRLLHFACTDTSELPLPPAAIQAAVKQCSGKKIEELEAEVHGLAEIFTRLRKLPADTRTIPIDRGALGLSEGDLDFLREQGFLYYHEKEAVYYMPEIIRHGLGYGLARRGRARVLSLVRAATASLR